MEHVDELIPAHALHALDADDERLVERHLEGCGRCRRLLREYEALAGTLAYAAPPAEPPPDLRQRVLDAVAADEASQASEPASGSAAAAPAPVRPRRSWREWWPRVSAVAVPALAVATIALAAWNLSLRSDLDASRSLASRPVVRVAGVGNAFATARGKVTLVTSLASAPSGKVYEAWVIRDGKPLPAGTFAGGSDQPVQLTQRVRAGDKVAVTLESAGGDHRTPHGHPLGVAEV